MKQKARRRKPRPGHSARMASVVKDRRLVLVDDGPLRARTASECGRALKKLDAARAEWRRYEQEDQPAFGRWMVLTFGALLTELRENERLIREQEALIAEVETEMILNGYRNPRKAYDAVMKRRENPEPNPDRRRNRANGGASGKDRASRRDKENGAADDFDPFNAGKESLPKEERKALFDDFLRVVLEINPRRLSKAEYAEMFAEFEAQTFGTRAEEKQAPPPETGRKGRLTELYRLLVKRLHPDLRADGDVRVSALWHEVQEAYGAGNIDRLETLLALTEMENGTAGSQTSLAQMRAAMRELKRALQALQRSIREAKDDPAWAFSRLDDRMAFEKRIRREMKENRSRQRSHLAELKQIVEGWLHSGRPSSGGRRRPGRAKGAFQPDLFSF